MDYTKAKIEPLNGSNWGKWEQDMTALLRTYEVWNYAKGNILTSASGTTAARTTYITEPDPAIFKEPIDLYRAQETWRSRNDKAIGIITWFTLPTLRHLIKGKGTAKECWEILENKYAKAGGAVTYLQVLSLLKSVFTDEDILSQLQKFQDDYQEVMSNGVSKISEDIAVFLLHHPFLIHFNPSPVPISQVLRTLQNWSSTTLSPKW